MDYNLKVACDAITTPPQVTCKVFEDNQSYIAAAESQKPLARTKHIAIKYYYFQSLVDNGIININHVDAKKQLTDILTKRVKDSQFLKLWHALMGLQKLTSQYEMRECENMWFHIVTLLTSRDACAHARVIASKMLPRVSLCRIYLVRTSFIMQ